MTTSTSRTFEQMTEEALIEAFKEVNKPGPVGIVINTELFWKLEMQRANAIAPPPAIAFLGTPMFHFHDVPGMVLFHSKSVLAAYLDARTSGADHLVAFGKAVIREHEERFAQNPDRYGLPVMETSPACDELYSPDFRLHDIIKLTDEQRRDVELHDC